MTQDSPFVFILSWERPIYTWVCLDSLYRTSGMKARFVIADNASKDPLVREVITGFERRGMFHKVHMYNENDPMRLGRMVEEYWDQIGDYFALIESDICAMPNKKGWLRTLVDHIENDPSIGSIGSRVYKPDFVSNDVAQRLEPTMNEKEISDLIKLKAPMRKHIVGEKELVSPHNPALRMLLLRKEAYAQVGFGRDVQIHRSMVANGWRSVICNSVVHRHLTLLNIFDNPDYDNARRNAFFDFSDKTTPPVRRENAVLILGMHRSGTSCLAGSLERAGLYLGDVVTESPFNKKGSRENKAAMKLHETVLRDNGGSWHSPPDKIVWNSTHLEDLDNLLETYPNSCPWGIKDPRMLLLNEPWLDRLNKPRFVASLRHPAEVVRSLRARKADFDDDAPLFDLWRTYSQALLAMWEKDPFPIINFNSSPTDYARQIAAVSDYLALPGAPREEPAFFEDRLRNDTAVTRAVPEDVAQLYERLLTASRVSLDKMTL